MNLEQDAAAYFAGLDEELADEESRLEKALSSLVDEIDFDVASMILISFLFS